MRTRKLGRDGPEVSAIGLGTMGLGGAYGPADEAEAVATIAMALDQGVNLFDTADFYGAGISEEILGKALAGRRDHAVIATKTGVRIGPGSVTVDGRPESITARAEASLGRLGTDRIDLYYLARVDPDVPIEESVGAMAELVKVGKVRHLGLCEASSSTLRRAARVHPIAALQSEYSVWERDIEADILPTLRALGGALVAYRPLGGGFLTGAITVDRLTHNDARRRDPRLSGGSLLRNFAIQDVVQSVAERKEVSAAQIALAWLLARGDDVIPIPGARQRQHLLDNLQAAQVKLSRSESDELAARLPPTSGARYPEPLLRTIDVSA
jgi:aryl-alcohol dehydrogenase-like predicted oxidoreductase